MPIDLKATFEAGGWYVIECDGHDYADMWKAIAEADQIKGQPVLLLGNTIMGQGVDFMQETGEAHKSSWHGNAPKPEQADEALAKLALSDDETKLVESIHPAIKWSPDEPNFPKKLSDVAVSTGKPVVYEPGTVTDCRSAYGNALLDLAKNNKNVVAATADLMGSVKTQGVHDELPDQHYDVGIAEQHMVSLGGGLSLSGRIPFVSTFGAFISSRAKDQARVNDINQANCKMVATHCGLSVGEDGPTHQAIDDMGSFLGMFNMHVMEPADANQCDRMIRYVASKWGNFYVRMGRHKFEVLTKEDGSLVYGPDYVYEYGKSDIIRAGEGLTVVASGAMVREALDAREKGGLNFELIAVSSIKKFDEQVFESIKRTGKVATIEDHNTISGLGGTLARELAKRGIKTEKYETFGVEEYQLSGKSADLYEHVGLSANKLSESLAKI